MRANYHTKENKYVAPAVSVYAHQKLIKNVKLGCSPERTKEFAKID
jgi:hypothetical protein